LWLAGRSHLQSWLRWAISTFSSSRVGGEVVSRVEVPSMSGFMGEAISPVENGTFDPIL